MALDGNDNALVDGSDNFNRAAMASVASIQDNTRLPLPSNGFTLYSYSL